MGSARDPRAGPYRIHPRGRGHVALFVEPWAGAKPRPFRLRRNLDFNSDIFFIIFIVRTNVARVVSPVLPVRCPETRSGVRPTVKPYNFIQNHEPTTGCHVAAHDWGHVAHQQPTKICQVSDAYSSTCLPPVTVPAQSLRCQRCHVTC